MLAEVGGVELGRADVELALRAAPELLLHEQVVDSDAVVVPVALQVLPSLFRVLVVVLELAEHLRVDWYCVLPHLDAVDTPNALLGGLQEPRMIFDVPQLHPPLRIGGQQSLDEVAGAASDKLGQSVVARDDLLVELRGVGVLEGQVAADHGEEHDPAGPDVGVEAQVLLARDHLGRGVAGRPAGGLEHFP